MLSVRLLVWPFLFVFAATPASRGGLPSTNPSTRQDEAASDASPPAAAASANAASRPSTLASAAATRPADEQVLALVAQLSDESFAVRDTAQAKLAELGESAEPTLTESLRNDLTDEAHSRVEAALHAIQERRAIGPTVITLDRTDAPLADVLAEFARQAHADLGLGRPDVKQACVGRKVSIHIDHKDFWDALRDVESASGLRPQQWGNERRMVLCSGFGGNDWLAGPGTSVGAFRFVAESCQLVRSVNYGQGGKASNFTVMLVALAEPKLRIVGLADASGAGPGNGAWLRECVDENGNSLIESGRSNYFWYNGGSWFWQLQANLKEPANMGKRIARLRGSLKFTIQTRSEIVEIDDVLKARNVTKSVGGSVLTLRDVSNQGGQYQVRFDLTVGDQNPARLQAVQSLAMAALLEDEKGQPLNVNGTSSRGDGRHVEVTLTYNRNGMMVNGQGAPGEPKKLIWEFPTETRDLVIPFELRDLQLP